MIALMKQTLAVGRTLVWCIFKPQCAFTSQNLSLTGVEIGCFDTHQINSLLVFINAGSLEQRRRFFRKLAIGKTKVVDGLYIDVINFSKCPQMMYVSKPLQM